MGKEEVIYQITDLDQPDKCMVCGCRLKYFEPNQETREQRARCYNPYCQREVILVEE